MAQRKSAQMVDRHMARELALYIENDADLYRQQYRPIVMNYARKKVKGNFDKELAVKGLVNLVENGRRKYSKEFYPRGQLMPMNGATKEACARQLLPGVMDEVNYVYKQMKALKDQGKPWSMMGQ